MADVNAIINIDINSSSALTNLKRLESQIDQFNRSVSTSNATAAASQQSLNRALLDGINNTGLFTSKIVPVESSITRFSKSLDEGRLSLGEYTRYASSQLPGLSRVFKKEFDSIEQVATSRVKSMQTQYLALGKTVDGVTRTIASTPIGLSKGFSTDIAMAQQRQQLFNKLLDDGSTKLLNFGKNTQWAGRQLMVGFSLPLAAFGAVAAKTFMEIDKATISLKRVYGDLSTTKAELDSNVEAVKGLGKEYTKYGITLAETISLSARAAATGATNKSLMAATEQTLRFATLGQMDYNQALDTTISLQTAFAISNQDLGKTVDYLNAVENQTILTMEDMSVAIPRVATVIKGLGGSVQDLAIMMTAMREGGVSAENAANGLKSGLASLINPTKRASESLASMGVNLNSIITQNKGDLMGIITEFGTAINKLDEFSRQQVLEQVFGKFQYARMSALFTNITKDAGQAARAMDIAGMSAADLAKISEKELGQISESTSVKFQAAMEQLKMSIAPIGEAFLKGITPVVSMVSKIADAFNNLPDGVKNAMAVVTAVVAGLGPVFLMTIGLLGNGLANLVKGFQFVRKMIAGIKGDASAFTYLSQKELEAVTASNALEGSTANLTSKLILQRGAVSALTAEYQRFASAAGIAGASMGRMGGAPAPSGGGRRPLPSPRGFAAGGIVPGTGNGDTIPALLTPGESVITKKATQKYAPILQQMNDGTLPGFAGGVTGLSRFLGRRTQFAHATGGRSVGGDEALRLLRPAERQLFQAPGSQSVNATALSGLTIGVSDLENQALRVGVGKGLNPKEFSQRILDEALTPDLFKRLSLPKETRTDFRKALSEEIEKIKKDSMLDDDLAKAFTRAEKRMVVKLKDKKELRDEFISSIASSRQDAFTRLKFNIPENAPMVANVAEARTEAARSGLPTPTEPFYYYHAGQRKASALVRMPDGRIVGVQTDATRKVNPVQLSGGRVSIGQALKSWQTSSRSVREDPEMLSALMSGMRPAQSARTLTRGTTLGLSRGSDFAAADEKMIMDALRSGNVSSIIGKEFSMSGPISYTAGNPQGARNAISMNTDVNRIKELKKQHSEAKEKNAAQLERIKNLRKRIETGRGPTDLYQRQLNELEGFTSMYAAGQKTKGREIKRLSSKGYENVLIEQRFNPSDQLLDVNAMNPNGTFMGKDVSRESEFISSGSRVRVTGVTTDPDTGFPKLILENIVDSVQKRALGGPIVPGIGSTDTVPAMLTPGEFVINKQSTGENLPLLHAINNGNVSGYAKGGQIPGMQYFGMAMPQRVVQEAAGMTLGRAFPKIGLTEATPMADALSMLNPIAKTIERRLGKNTKRSTKINNEIDTIRSEFIQSPEGSKVLDELLKSLESKIDLPGVTKPIGSDKIKERIKQTKLLEKIGLLPSKKEIVMWHSTSKPIPNDTLNPELNYSASNRSNLKGVGFYGTERRELSSTYLVNKADPNAEASVQYAYKVKAKDFLNVDNALASQSLRGLKRQYENLTASSTSFPNFEEILIAANKLSKTAGRKVTSIDDLRQSIFDVDRGSISSQKLWVDMVKGTGKKGIRHTGGDFAGDGSSPHTVTISYDSVPIKRTLNPQEELDIANFTRTRNAISNEYFNTRFIDDALLPLANQGGLSEKSQLLLNRIKQLNEEKLQIEKTSSSINQQWASSEQRQALIYAGESNAISRGATNLNAGGTIPGVGNTDKVPAMLTPGEFVINKQATQSNLSLLHAINDGNTPQSMQGFNKGGEIPGVQYFGGKDPGGEVKRKEIPGRDTEKLQAALEKTRKRADENPTRSNISYLKRMEEAVILANAEQSAAEKIRAEEDKLGNKTRKPPQGRIARGHYISEGNDEKTFKPNKSGRYTWIPQSEVSNQVSSLLQGGTGVKGATETIKKYANRSDPKVVSVLNKIEKGTKLSLKESIIQRDIFNKMLADQENLPKNFKESLVPIMKESVAATTAGEKAMKDIGLMDEEARKEEASRILKENAKQSNMGNSKGSIPKPTPEEAPKKPKNISPERAAAINEQARAEARRNLNLPATRSTSTPYAIEPGAELDTKGKTIGKTIIDEEQKRIANRLFDEEKAKNKYMFEKEKKKSEGRARARQIAEARKTQSGMPMQEERTLAQLAEEERLNQKAKSPTFFKKGVDAQGNKINSKYQAKMSGMGQHAMGIGMGISMAAMIPTMVADEQGKFMGMDASTASMGLMSAGTAAMMLPMIANPIGLAVGAAAAALGGFAIIVSNLLKSEDAASIEAGKLASNIGGASNALKKMSDVLGTMQPSQKLAQLQLGLTDKGLSEAAMKFQGSMGTEAFATLLTELQAATSEERFSKLSDYLKNAVASGMLTEKDAQEFGKLIAVQLKDAVLGSNVQQSLAGQRTGGRALLDLAQTRSDALQKSEAYTTMRSGKEFTKTGGQEASSVISGAFQIITQSSNAIALARQQLEAGSISQYDYQDIIAKSTVLQNEYNTAIANALKNTNDFGSTMQSIKDQLLGLGLSPETVDAIDKARTAVSNGAMNEYTRVFNTNTGVQDILKNLTEAEKQSGDYNVMGASDTPYGGMNLKDALASAGVTDETKKALSTLGSDLMTAALANPSAQAQYAKFATDVVGTSPESLALQETYGKYKGIPNITAQNAIDASILGQAVSSGQIPGAGSISASTLQTRANRATGIETGTKPGAAFNNITQKYVTAGGSAANLEAAMLSVPEEKRIKFIATFENLDPEGMDKWMTDYSKLKSLFPGEDGTDLSSSITLSTEYKDANRKERESIMNGAQTFQGLPDALDKTLIYRIESNDGENPLTGPEAINRVKEYKKIFKDLGSKNKATVASAEMRLAFKYNNKKDVTPEQMANIRKDVKNWDKMLPANKSAVLSLEFDLRAKFNGKEEFAGLGIDSSKSLKNIKKQIADKILEQQAMLDLAKTLGGVNPVDVAKIQDTINKLTEANNVVETAIGEIGVASGSPKSGGGGGGSNPLLDFKKSLLEQIKLYADIGMTLKKLFSSKMSILGILGKNKGIDDKLRAAGLGETMVQSIMGMGADAANKWAKANISGGKLNAAGKQQQTIARANVLGAAGSQAEGAIGSAATQQRASKLLAGGKYGKANAQTLSMIAGSPELADAYTAAVDEVIAADQKYKNASKGDKKDAKNEWDKKRESLEQYIERLNKASIDSTVAGKLEEARNARLAQTGKAAATASLGKNSKISKDVREAILGDPTSIVAYNELEQKMNNSIKAAAKKGKGSRGRNKQARLDTANFQDFLSGQEALLGDPEERRLQANLDTLNQAKVKSDRLYKEQTDPLLEQIELINRQIDAIQKLNNADQNRIRNLTREKEMLERQVETLNRKNEVDQKSIEKLQREDEMRTRVADALNHELSLMSEQETKIREAYDKRVKALDEVAKINDYIINQQKSQLGLAQALSQGDVYAAAAAQQDMQTGTAQFAQEQMRSGLQTGMENQVAGLTTSGGLTRVQAEDQIRAIGEQTYQTSLLVRDLQDAIYGRNLEIAAIKLQERDIDDSILVIQDDIYKRETEIIGLQTGKLTDLNDQLTAIQDQKNEVDKVAEANIMAAEVAIENYNLGIDQVDIVNKLALQWREVVKQIQNANLAMKNSLKELGPEPTDPGTEASKAAKDAYKKSYGEWKDKYDKIIADNKKAKEDAYASGTVASAAVSAPVAAAATVATTPIAGGQGMMFATGGIVGQGGRDSVPSMLTPGEYVMRKASVQKYGMPMLSKMNMGAFDMPRYDTQQPNITSVQPTSNTSNINAPVYNTYSVNVSANTNASADDIANTVMTKIKRVDSMAVRSFRGY